MDSNRSETLYDALIIGGGPAGLSAAIYLGRAGRSVAVVARPRPGRSDWAQVNRNYLGFPEGISVVELCARGRRQAERFGAHFYRADVAALGRQDACFAASAPDLALRGRAVVLATGVTDRWPAFPGYEAFIGRSMHWCSVCDGPEMVGKRVLVVGNDESAAELAIQLLRFAERVTLLTNDDALGLSAAAARALNARGIRVVVDRLAAAREAAPGWFAAVRLAGGGEIAVDHMFSAQGADPNTDVARQLGVELTAEGYIKVDTEAATSIPGVYAAGDVTRLFSHQVLTAAHEGATAATALDHWLFEGEQAGADAGPPDPHDARPGRLVA